MASVTPEREPGAAPERLAAPPARRGWRVAAYVLLALALVAALGWVSTHPAELGTTDAVVTASTPVGTPVHVGVFTAPAAFDRTLHVSGVRVFATSTAAVTIVPHLCDGGSLRVTTTPESFCADFGSTEGATLGRGDTIVLEVLGEVPASVRIDRVRIAYREGLQWATQDAGARAEVVVLAR